MQTSVHAVLEYPVRDRTGQPCRAYKRQNARLWYMVKTLLERAFFGKDSCLVVSMNNENQCYFQFGKITGKDAAGKDAWLWKKTKMNDVELGDIISVLEGTKQKTSFFHSFEKGATKTQTQIWVERLDGGNVRFSVKEAGRALMPGEQQVLLLLLRHIILMMNLTL